MEQQWTYEELERLHTALAKDFLVLVEERDDLKATAWDSYLRARTAENKAIAIRLEADRKVALTRWAAVVGSGLAFVLGLVVR